jgi:threonine synthase
MVGSPAVVGLRCVRCGAPQDPGGTWFGCPICSETVPANLEFVYRAPIGPEVRDRWERRPPGLWRYAEGLPVRPERAVSLGEGGTPLVECGRVGAALGLPRLLAKHELQNPTWSFKDRLASVAVSWAVAAGSPGVVLSSSGNAGASAAAYAARAGLRCLVLTTRAFPAGMRRFMRSFGAMVVAAPSGPERWALNRQVARAWGWLPISNLTDPPVGSHPAGVEGCKTIAYEIAQDLGWQAPDAVVVPVGYGDALAGLHRGFRELLAAGLIDRLPRMVAAEAFPSLSRALAAAAEAPVRTEGGHSRAHSVATPVGTYQALRALRESGGTAVALSDGEIAEAHRDLRRREGLLVEFSSAMALAAARRLAAAGELGGDDRVVLLLTSGGLKDAEVTVEDAELPVVPPELGALTETLRSEYGFRA